jgi:hypothetical protein
MAKSIILTARGDASFALSRVNDLLGAGSNLDQFVTGTAIVASALLLAGRPQEAHTLLTELDARPDARGNSNYPTVLAGIVRTALRAGDTELAQRLSEGVEVAGDHAEAVALYASAAEQWEELGAVPEQADALLGQGRSLLALDEPGAERPLAQAAELFRAMGYRPRSLRPNRSQQG